MLVGAAYEALARSGLFPAALLPTLPRVASTLLDQLYDGVMIEHALFTMYRVLFGLALAIVVALPLGILMGRFRPVERFCLPLASALMPIPSLAWVPVFILWFGSATRLRSSSCFTPPYFHLAQCLVGCAFRQSALVAARGRHGREPARAVLESHHSRRLALIITGLRQAFLRAWIAVVGARCWRLPTGDWAG